MPIPCSIPSVCYSSKHRQPFCFMLHHHNTQKWHLPSSMIVKTAFRQGNTHTMVVAEWKKQENDPTVWARWRPFVLYRAKNFDKQLHADANWPVHSEVFSLSFGTLLQVCDYARTTMPFLLPQLSTWEYRHLSTATYWLILHHSYL